MIGSSPRSSAWSGGSHAPAATASTMRPAPTTTSPTLLAALSPLAAAAIGWILPGTDDRLDEVNVPVASNSARQFKKLVHRLIVVFASGKCDVFAANPASSRSRYEP